jgi:hypothetical protein
VKVEPEKDLSQMQQFLDLLIVRETDAPPPHPLPDGFDNLGQYNLVTFKSYQETLDGEVLEELLSYQVLLRKIIRRETNTPVPRERLRRYAVCVRSPQKLANETALRSIRPGVYEADHFTGFIRVIVIHELPCEPQNAILLLFSARSDLIDYGARNCQLHSPETNTLLLHLIKRYRQEEIPMPVTLEELVRQTRKELVQELSAEDLAHLPPEKRLEGLSPEKRLEGLSPKARLAGLTPEQRLDDLTPEQAREAMEILAQRLQKNTPQPPAGPPGGENS